MKVALLSYLFGQNMGGGAAASARRLAYGLRDRDIDVTVITTHDGPASTTTTADGIRIHALPPGNLYWVEDKDDHAPAAKVLWQLVDTWNPRQYGPVKRLLVDEAPDIVHVHKMRGLSPAVWSAAAAAGCRPIIQTCRDYEAMSPEGTLTTGVGRLAERGAWAVRPYQAFRARVSDHLDMVTAPSQYTLDMLTSRGFFRRAAQAVVPNTHGLTLGELAALRVARELGGDNNERPIRFLYLGRLEAIKGVSTLCEAFLHVATGTPDAELHIVGFGTQEEALREAYEEHPCITFHGAVYGDAKQALVGRCDVQVVPSEWAEVFGNVIVEAYAFGMPVIASCSGGMPEVIVEGQTGFLVPPGDVPALAAALEQFIHAPQLVATMSEACFVASRDYAVETITDGYLRAYAEAQDRVGHAGAARALHAAGEGSNA